MTLFVLFLSQSFFINIEEIVGQDSGNTQKEFRINTTPLKNAVHVCSLAAYLLGEPRHTPALFAQYVLNHFPDVNSHIKTKRSVNFTCSSRSMRASQSPYQIEKQPKSTPDMLPRPASVS